MAEEEGKQIGTVSNYFDHCNVAAVKLDATIKVGDTIRIAGGEVDFDQTVDSMEIQREKVESAKAGDEIGLVVKEKVRKGYKVFKI